MLLQDVKKGLTTLIFMYRTFFRVSINDCFLDFTHDIMSTRQHVGKVY
jgi:hypothetical protein